MVIEYRAYTMKPGYLGRFYEMQVERGFDGVMAPIMRVDTPQDVVSA